LLEFNCIPALVPKIGYQFVQIKQWLRDFYDSLGHFLLCWRIIKKLSWRTFGALSKKNNHNTCQ